VTQSVFTPVWGEEGPAYDEKPTTTKRVHDTTKLQYDKNPDALCVTL